ncbi:hypothetical protein J6590_019105, partial [Homalodisca vitripennis]
IQSTPAPNDRAGGHDHCYDAAITVSALAGCEVSVVLTLIDAGFWVIMKFLGTWHFELQATGFI